MSLRIKHATEFQDWDVARRETIFKTFPAGTKVKDCLRAGNPSNVRLYAPIGTVGWIASIHQSATYSR